LRDLDVAVLQSIAQALYPPLGPDRERDPLSGQRSSYAVPWL
jgi:hypothetical protein